ncbi:MAG: hypothetical protein ACOCQ9_00920, partial [Candidatus Brocadiia bacterium]
KYAGYSIPGYTTTGRSFRQVDNSFSPCEWFHRAPLAGEDSDLTLRGESMIDRDPRIQIFKDPMTSAARL